MKKTLAFVGGVVALAAAAGAQVSYTGGVYGENFDGLGAGATGVFPNPLGTQIAIPGVTAWRGAKIAGNTAAMNWVVNDGAGNAGALYNYGVTGDVDRALGSLASGTNVGAFGVEIVNDGTDAIDTFTIVFSGEQYRSSTTTQNILAFAWGQSSDGVLSTDFLTSALMTTDTDGDIIGQGPVTTNGIIAPPANLGEITLTITGLNVAVGESVFFRWQDADNLGSDGGLAIDNFRFSATFVPTPGAAVLLGLGGLLAARRRR